MATHLVRAAVAKVPGLGGWSDDPLWASFYDWTVEHPRTGGLVWRAGIQSDLRLLYRAAAEIGRQPAGARILDVPCGGGVALRGLRPGQDVEYVAADIAPEMLAVWHIQRQLVADIAAIYGRSADLGPAQMLWCLFRHTAAQALRDLSVRVGERVIVRPAAQALLQRVAGAVGLHLGQQAASRMLSRWVPVVGAAGVGAYAWWDTRQVGRAALLLFEREQVIDNPV